MREDKFINLKTFVSLLLLTILSFQKANSQGTDLLELSLGKFQNINVVTKANQSVFGYVATILKEEINTDESRYEFIVLDKNLNEITRNDFTGSSLVEYYYGVFTIWDELLLVPEPKSSVNWEYRNLKYPETFKSI